jgi:hypothetical protein
VRVYLGCNNKRGDVVMRRRRLPDSNIRFEVRDFISRLVYTYADRWAGEYTVDLRAEREDLEKLLEDLRRLVNKAKRFHEGGYTIFAYEVLVGVYLGMVFVEERASSLEDELAGEFDEED